MYSRIPVHAPLKIQYFSVLSANIIQWNSQINVNKKTEIMDLISKEKPDVFCIHETMLPNQTNFNLKYEHGLFQEGHTNSEHPEE